MTTHWYVLRSKPRKESVVWKHATAIGHEVFYPRLRVNPVNPRANKVKPYFPGYMFIHEDLDEKGLSHFQWMPYSLGLVNFGGEPARVPPSIIYALQRRIKEVNAVKKDPLAGMRRGDKLRVVDGPFEGYKALFNSRIGGDERVRVLLEMLSGQQVKLDLKVNLVERTK
jgi:transcriptional antiterminator RfaH